jgi:hypothetical protein
MPKQHEFTRWRSLDDPVSPLDPIQPDSPRYVEGELPVGFILLLWDGEALIGPMQFKSSEEAYVRVLKAQDEKKPIQQYLVVPKP